MGTPSLARHRDMWLLLLGQTTSQFGGQVSAVTKPLLAVVTLGATDFQVGLMGSEAERPQRHGAHRGDGILASSAHGAYLVPACVAAYGGW